MIQIHKRLAEAMGIAPDKNGFYYIEERRAKTTELTPFDVEKILTLVELDLKARTHHEISEYQEHYKEQNKGLIDALKLAYTALAKVDYNSESTWDAEIERKISFVLVEAANNRKVTTEQAAIIKPEWEKMQDFLKPKPIPPLNSVYVKFENEAFNYSTSVSAATTEKSAREYFVGTSFNVEAYPSEATAECIDIEFINNQKI